MTFLQPAVLIALPVAALPVIIHLIHLYRRRQIKWAAMIFLRAAQQMNKGLSRLRQIRSSRCACWRWLRSSSSRAGRWPAAGWD